VAYNTVAHPSQRQSVQLQKKTRVSHLKLKLMLPHPGQGQSPSRISFGSAMPPRPCSQDSQAVKHCCLPEPENAHLLVINIAQIKVFGVLGCYVPDRLWRRGRRWLANVPAPWRDVVR